jgi:hypothetical protein
VSDDQMNNKNMYSIDYGNSFQKTIRIMKKIGIIVLFFALIGCRKMDILTNSKYYVWSFSGKNPISDIKLKYPTTNYISDSDTVGIGGLLYHSDTILTFQCPVIKGVEKEFRNNIQLSLNSKSGQIADIKFIDIMQYKIDTIVNRYNGQYSNGYYFGYKSPEPEFVNIAYSFYHETLEETQNNKYSFNNFDYEIIHKIDFGSPPLLRHRRRSGGYNYYVIKDKKTKEIRRIISPPASETTYLFKNKYLLVIINHYGGYNDFTVGLIDLSEYFKNSK